MTAQLFYNYLGDLPYPDGIVLVLIRPYSAVQRALEPAVLLKPVKKGVRQKAISW